MNDSQPGYAGTTRIDEWIVTTACIFILYVSVSFSNYNIIFHANPKRYKTRNDLLIKTDNLISDKLILVT